MTVVGTGTKASGVLMWKRIGKDHRGRGCDDVLTAADFECRMMLGGSGVMTNALQPRTLAAVVIMAVTMTAACCVSRERAVGLGSGCDDIIACIAIGALP